MRQVRDQNVPAIKGDAGDTATGDGHVARRLGRHGAQPEIAARRGSIGQIREIGGFCELVGQPIGDGAGKVRIIAEGRGHSLSVSSAPGAASISAAMAAATKPVVAICVVLVPLAAVGAVGLPVNAGEDSRTAQLDD